MDSSIAPEVRRAFVVGKRASHYWDAAAVGGGDEGRADGAHPELRP